MELIAVAVLTLAVVFTLNETTVRHTSSRENLFRGLSTLLIALTGVILVSAFQRLRLYEQTYGFTSLRLEIYVFIVWLGIAFAGFTLSLYWKPALINVFGLCALISVIGFVATLDVLNPDAFVTRQNIQRGDIDPLYLSTLSIEAAPALLPLLDAPEPGLRAVVQETLREYLIQLDDESADFRDFNIGRANARAALESVRSRLVADSLQDPRESSSHTLDEFKSFPKVGMTVRQVARQFGKPYTYYGSTDQARAGSHFVMYYYLKEGYALELRFDTKNGLEEACPDSSKGSCIVQSRP